MLHCMSYRCWPHRYQEQLKGYIETEDNTPNWYSHNVMHNFECFWLATINTTTLYFLIDRLHITCCKPKPKYKKKDSWIVCNYLWLEKIFTGHRFNMQWSTLSSAAKLYKHKKQWNWRMKSKTLTNAILAYLPLICKCGTDLAKYLPDLYIWLDIIYLT